MISMGVKWPDITFAQPRRNSQMRVMRISQMMKHGREIPAELPERAQRVSGTGITETVRTGFRTCGCVGGVCKAAEASRSGSFFADFG